MSNSRTQYVAKNAIIGIVSQVATSLLMFLSRTVFIHILGKDYLGVSGLYTNILTILSFAELGIGNALIYSLYKPLKENNIDKIKSLMALYKKSYYIIGIVIAVVGLSFIPFLDTVIANKPDINENLIFIYLFYLANSVLSYFWVYKRSIIIADQKNYIVTLYYQAIHIIQTVTQIAFLWLTHNFIVFILIQILFTVCNNWLISRKADKLYPYLKEKAEKLEKKEANNIFRNVRALAVYKFASVILNCTDNIIVSLIFGVAYVGIYSNYLLITTVFLTFFSKITEAFTASVGNLNTNNDPEKQYSVFKKLFFICTWLYGFASVGIMLLVNDFIPIWIGSDYALSTITVFAIVLHFYVNAVNFAAYTYRTTLGYFVQGRIAPAIAAALNIALSIVLGKKFGLCGVFFATSISRFFTIGIIDPILIYKNTFHKNPIRYYIDYFMYFGLFTAFYLLLKYILQYVVVYGVLGLIIKGAIITLVFNSLMILIFYQTKMFKELLYTVRCIIHRGYKKCI